VLDVSMSEQRREKESELCGSAFTLCVHRERPALNF